MGGYGHPIDTTKYSTWAINITNFDSAVKNRVNYSNFVDHSVFLANYVQGFINVLKAINGTSYTDKQYQMAAMYGLDNPGDPPSNPVYINGINIYELNKQVLALTFNDLMKKYKITSAERNSFYLDNLKNVPVGKKLPTNCPD